MDRIAEFFSQKTARRILVLVLFGATLYLFRHLAILLVFFVAFERAMGWSAGALSARIGVSRKKCVLLVLGVFFAVLGALMWMGIGESIRVFAGVQDDLPERLAKLREHPLVDRLEAQIGGLEKVVETAKHYSGSALAAAIGVGHFLIHIVMGFILALVYVLEQEEIEAFWSKVERRSIVGTLGRWFGHVADATVVTVQLQLIVAACNTAMTLPVLLIIGVPNVAPLMLLIFVSAMVPVIGNIVSGVTLSILAYQQKGWLGVGIFIGLTFFLHKIESYYLSPRLTARHVKMPGFLLIVSLIACEHLFGFTGLFLSFPILFIVGRIRTDFAEEDTGATSSPIDLSDDPAQLLREPLDGVVSASGMELDHAAIRLDEARPAATEARPTPLETATEATGPARETAASAPEPPALR